MRFIFDSINSDCFFSKSKPTADTDFVISAHSLVDHNRLKVTPQAQGLAKKYLYIRRKQQYSAAHALFPFQHIQFTTFRTAPFISIQSDQRKINFF
jgi:hypothetical protein